MHPQFPCKHVQETTKPKWSCAKTAQNLKAVQEDMTGEVARSCINHLYNYIYIYIYHCGEPFSVGRGFSKSWLVIKVMSFLLGDRALSQTGFWLFAFEGRL